MARVRDVPCAVRTVGPVQFVKDLVKRINDDDLTTQAAAVAYAWLFAVFPFLLFLLTLLYYIPERNKVDAPSKIRAAVHTVLAPQAADILVENLDQVFKPHGGLLSISLLVTLYVASGGMRTTMWSLDTAYDAKRRRPFWIQWPLAVLLTVIVTVAVVGIMLLLPVGSAVSGWLMSRGWIPPGLLWLFDVARFTLAVGLILFFLSLLYQFGTVVRHPFTFVSPGAIFTLFVWFLLGTGFNLYVSRFGSYQKTYGAIGGVFILLLFFYLDALVLLIGAEINSHVEECCRASRQQRLFTEGGEPTAAASVPRGE